VEGGFIKNDQPTTDRETKLPSANHAKPASENLNGCTKNAEAFIAKGATEGWLATQPETHMPPALPLPSSFVLQRPPLPPPTVSASNPRTLPGMPQSHIIKFMEPSAPVVGRATKPWGWSLRQALRSS